LVLVQLHGEAESSIGTRDCSFRTFSRRPAMT
jgi:hypothetical protein